jgi:uncharacterized membrane protein
LGRAGRWTLIIAFPLAYALLAHHTNTARLAGLGTLIALAPLILMFLTMAWQATYRKTMLALFALGCLGLGLAWGKIQQFYSIIYWLEHAGTELVLCLAFARTLRADREPMVTYFARLVHGSLTPALQVYTRQVTKAWVCFFCAMASVSTVLFHAASLEVWSAFANFLTAPLIGLMFIAEYVVRRRLHPQMNHANIADGIKAYWNAPVKASSGSSQ